MKNFLNRFLYFIYRFFVFLFIIGFTLTCNVILFLNVAQKISNIQLGSVGIVFAAMFTLINAFFIALAFTAFDYFRRKITVSTPVKRILDATQRVIRGDFTVRIKKAPMSNFNPVIKNLNQMLEELEKTETFKTDFAANVSHEIKTPLAVISNYGMLLEQPDISDEQRIEYAKNIVSTAGRLSDLTSNILKLSKLENQIITPNLRVCCLSEMMCECLLMYENEWEKKNLEIETDIEMDINLLTDSEMLGLVWNNLFSNAIKFTPEGGKITVTLKSDDNFITAAVSDTGCGMDAETGKHIFEKFYQGDTSRATQGNGLGLSLVKRIIEILKADIYVESEPGIGSTFTVKFKKQ